jgi:chorismate mutase
MATETDLRPTSAAFDDIALLAPLALAEVNDDTRDKLRKAGEWWVDLLKVGDFYPLLKGSDRKPVKITDKILGELAEIFPRVAAMFRGALPVDANHATRMGRNGSDTKRRAGIAEVRVVGDTLQGLFRWSGLGLGEVLDEGAWESVSAELADVVDKQTGKPIGASLIGATVTNDPFLNTLGGLIPAMLSEITAGNRDATVVSIGSTSAPHEEDPMPDLIERLAEVQPGITEDQAVTMLAEVATLRETIATRDADAVKLTEARDTLQAEVATLKAAKVEANTEIVALSERLGTMEAGLTAAREASTIEADMQRNAVATAEAGTADEPGPARKLWRRDVELYAEVYGNRPDNYATTGGGKTGTTAPAPKAPATDAPDYSTVATQDAAEDLIVSLAERYMEEHADVDYGTAERRVVRNINEAKPGDGDRLHTLMMEV